MPYQFINMDELVSFVNNYIRDALRNDVELAQMLLTEILQAHPGLQPRMALN